MVMVEKPPWETSSKMLVWLGSILYVSCANADCVVDAPRMMSAPRISFFIVGPLLLKVGLIMFGL